MKAERERREYERLVAARLAWSLAADLLEREPPEDDLDRQIRKAAGRLGWQDCGARLVSCLRELHPYLGEVEAARQVAAWLPTLRPRNWASSPQTGLLGAILAAYWASPWITTRG